MFEPGSVLGQGAGVSEVIRVGMLHYSVGSGRMFHQCSHLPTAGGSESRGRSLLLGRQLSGLDLRDQTVAQLACRVVVLRMPSTEMLSLAVDLDGPFSGSHQPKDEGDRHH